MHEHFRHQGLRQWHTGLVSVVAVRAVITILLIL